MGKNKKRKKAKYQKMKTMQRKKRRKEKKLKKKLAMKKMDILKGKLGKHLHPKTLEALFDPQMMDPTEREIKMEIDDDLEPIKSEQSKQNILKMRMDSMNLKKQNLI